MKRIPDYLVVMGDNGKRYFLFKGVCVHLASVEINDAANEIVLRIPSAAADSGALEFWSWDDLVRSKTPEAG